MSEIPTELRYLSTHEWVRVEDGTVTVGITAHAQDAMGDLVYVEVPEEGRELAAGDDAGVVESVKAASDIYSPVSGAVIAVNERLESEPELVNTDPYGDGWMFKVSITDESQLENLLTPDEYQSHIEDE